MEVNINKMWVLAIVLLCCSQTFDAKPLNNDTKTATATTSASKTETLPTIFDPLLLETLKRELFGNKTPLATLHATSSASIRSPKMTSSEHTFIKLDGNGQQQQIPQNSAIIVQGDSSMRLFDHADIDHPSFDPRNFLSTAANESVQPVEVAPVAGQPYFMFVPQSVLKDQASPKDLLHLFTKHRVKRHHPSLLQNVLGELQNYALVPIKSSNGQIRYILLKNPKFIIGNVPKGVNKGQRPPAIIQLGKSGQVKGQGGPNGQLEYQPQLKGAGQMPALPSPKRRPVQMERFPRPVPLASSIDSTFNDGSASASSSFSSGASQSASSSAAASSASHTSHSSSSSSKGGVGGHHAAHHSHGSGSGGDTHTVQKTEVVETVVESSKAAAAAAKQEAAASSAASQSLVTKGHGSVHGPAVVETAAAAASSQQSAAASSATKQEKTVKKVKKTTTTVVKKGGAAGGVGAGGPAAGSGGAVQEVKQVVEEAVHHDAKVAASASASESAAAASNSAASNSAAAPGAGLVDIRDGSGVKTDTVAAAASASSASAASSASESTKSTKKVTKTKKTTTVTKKVISKGGGSASSQGGAPAQTLVTPIQPTGNTGMIVNPTHPTGATNKGGNPPKAILSDNNDRPVTIDGIKAQLLPIDNTPPLPIPMMPKTSTVPPERTTITEEAEVEAEEGFATTKRQQSTVFPGFGFGGFGIGSTYPPFQSHAQQTTTPPLAPAPVPAKLPQGVVGWAGPTTEPALGSHDRLNTTDLPEEIEVRPDKNVPYTVVQQPAPVAQLPSPIASLPVSIAQHAVPVAHAPVVNIAPLSSTNQHQHVYRYKRALPNWYVYFPTYTNSPTFRYRSQTSRAGVAGVAGWNGPATIEPALGSHDRLNTTDMPEEVEAAPDKTPAERRREYLRKNPNLTEQEIIAMEKKMFAARAKAAANQVDPVVLAPVVLATAPPGSTRRRNKPAAPAKTQPKHKLMARRNQRKGKGAVPSKPKQRPQPTTKKRIPNTTAGLWRSDVTEPTPIYDTTPTDMPYWDPTTQPMPRWRQRQRRPRPRQRWRQQRPRNNFGRQWNRPRQQMGRQQRPMYTTPPTPFFPTTSWQQQVMGSGRWQAPQKSAPRPRQQTGPQQQPQQTMSRPVPTQQTMSGPQTTLQNKQGPITSQQNLQTTQQNMQRAITSQQRTLTTQQNIKGPITSQQRTITTQQNNQRPPITSQQRALQTTQQNMKPPITSQQRTITTQQNMAGPGFMSPQRPMQTTQRNMPRLQMPQQRPQQNMQRGSQSQQNMQRGMKSQQGPQQNMQRGSQSQQNMQRGMKSQQGPQQNMQRGTPLNQQKMQRGPQSQQRQQQNMQRGMKSQQNMQRGPPQSQQNTQRGMQSQQNMQPQQNMQRGGRRQQQQRPPRQRFQQNRQQFQQGGRGQPPRRAQRRRRPTPPPTQPPPSTPYMTDPLVTVTPPYMPTAPPTAPPRRRQMRRNRQRNQQQQQPQRKNRRGNRQRGRRRPADGEAGEYPPFVPRDPFSRWVYNNMDGEIFEQLFPFWMLG